MCQHVQEPWQNLTLGARLPETRRRSTTTLAAVPTMAKANTTRRASAKANRWTWCRRVGLQKRSRGALSLSLFIQRQHGPLKLFGAIQTRCNMDADLGSGTQFTVLRIETQWCLAACMYSPRRKALITELFWERMKLQLERHAMQQYKLTHKKGEKQKIFGFSN